MQENNCIHLSTLLSYERGLHGWLKQAQGHTDMCEGARADTQRGDGHPTQQVGKWIINLI